MSETTVSLQWPAAEPQSWIEQEIDQHQEKMKKPTYIGENVLPELERRKNPFGDLISELEWENQPFRKIKSNKM